MAGLLEDDPNTSIRRLTQREEPPAKHECIQVREQLVRTYTKCLGAFDLFHEYVQFHGFSGLIEEPTFKRAFQASQHKTGRYDRQRAAIHLAWGEAEADHFLKRQEVKGSVSLTILTMVKTIAGRMTLPRFKLLANALMLVRHRVAVANSGEGRSTSIAAMPRSFEKELRLIRDSRGAEISYCDVQIDDAVHRDVEAWVEDRDGSVMVEDIPLKARFPDSTARNFHMVELDAHGWLVGGNNTARTHSPLFATPPASSSRSSVNEDVLQQPSSGLFVTESVDSEDSTNEPESSPGVSIHEAVFEASEKRSRLVSNATESTTDSTTSNTPLRSLSAYSIDGTPPFGTPETGSMTFGTEPAATGRKTPSTGRFSEASTVIGSPLTIKCKHAILDVSPPSPYTGADAESVYLSDSAPSDAGLEAEAEFGDASSSESDMPPTPCDGCIATVPIVLADDQDSPVDRPAFSLVDMRKCASSRTNEKYMHVRSLMLAPTPCWGAIALRIGRWSTQTDSDWMSKARSCWFSPVSPVDVSDLPTRCGRARENPQSPGSSIEGVCFTKEELAELTESSRALDTISFVLGRRQNDEDGEEGKEESFEDLLKRFKELDATSVLVLHATDSTPSTTLVGDMIEDMTGAVPLLAMHTGEQMETIAPMGRGDRLRLLDRLLRKSCNRRDCGYLQESSSVRAAVSTDYIANLEACSGARVDVLGGTWIKISLGVAVLATVQERHNLDHLRELSAAGRLWRPPSPLPATIMRRGDVAYLPAGTIYSLAAVDKCHISFRVVWDDQDILSSLVTLAELSDAEIIKLIGMGICPKLPTGELLRELNSNDGCVGEGRPGADYAGIAAARRVLRILGSASDGSVGSPVPKRRRIEL